MSNIKYGFRGQDATVADLQAAVGPGWSNIIKRLVDDLFALEWDGCVLQVKEKFGGLRFYVGSTNDAIHERIMVSECESVKTCEECGAPGKQRGGGWIKTLCDEHAEGRRGFQEEEEEIG